MAFSFLPEVKTCLKNAGWSPERRVSVTSIEKRMLDEGYEWFEEVSLFMESFGGLSINFRYEGRKADVQFDAVEAAKSFDSYWIIENYAKRIGKAHFCPIGLAYTEHLLLFMSNDGYVYGGFDEYLALIGQREESVENILYRKNFVEFSDLQ